MTSDPWNSKSVMKVPLELRERGYQQKKALKGFLLSLVFYSECSVFHIECGNDIYISRLLTYTGRCHSNQCEALTQVLGGLLGPIDYFTNLGGGRDGIFLIIRHSNVMFSLAVTPPTPTP